MTKVVYSGEQEGFKWRYVLPWCILSDVMRYRSLIRTMAAQNFRAMYQSSFLGTAWQILLPIVTLAIFYLVFGRIFGGRFLNNGNESAVDYALALFFGLGFFNFIAQNINTAVTLIRANASFVKSLSFPLETLPVINVLNSLAGFLIGLVIALTVLYLDRGHFHTSVVLVPLYVFFVFLMSLGLSWGLSALAVFLNDLAAITGPLTLILMFMCPIFYPASMVPERIKWIIHTNPLSIVIEDVRASIMYGMWPSVESLIALFFTSLAIACLGYFVFMRSKRAFADVI